MIPEHVTAKVADINESLESIRQGDVHGTVGSVASGSSLEFQTWRRDYLLLLGNTSKTELLKLTRKHLNTFSLKPNDKDRCAIDMIRFVLKLPDLETLLSEVQHGGA